MMGADKGGRPDWLPESFEGVTLRDIDLDAEEFYVGGERLTEARAVELAERAERRGGRPSLTAPGAHSPALNLRVSADTKARLEAVAVAEGRRQSDVVREALDEYLDRHAS